MITHIISVRMKENRFLIDKKSNLWLPSIYLNALNRSDNREDSTLAHLFLNYHLITVPRYLVKLIFLLATIIFFNIKIKFNFMLTLFYYEYIENSIYCLVWVPGRSVLIIRIFYFKCILGKIFSMGPVVVQGTYIRW